jgi:AAA domain
MTDHRLPQLTPQQQQTALERARQLFRFLKAYSERRTPLKRTLADHEWNLPLRILPTHSSIVIGEVLLNTEPTEQGEAGGNGALLTIRRPRLTDPPTPPTILTEWLEKGWMDPARELRVRAELHVTRNGETATELFVASPQRTEALAQWRPKWDVWAQAELPAHNARRVFEVLYQLYNRIQMESERVELMLGDGQLRWQRGSERIDHPVLLQRVQLEFDSKVPEIRVVDADRAPELYTAVLDSSDSLAPQQLTQLRRDLELRGYHPLEREATNGFLKQLVQQLGPRGAFHDAPVATPAGEDPLIERNPVLFLRMRVLGFSDAFDRVLQELEADDAAVPLSLVRLVGIEPAKEPDTEPQSHSPWGEPPDVLLSKPANAEQIAIARALERHCAVQVQGPPGTGKSHTIANLIGHLVANGKRVLVTSHTTKALRVLRQHIVEPLRPLAVAVRRSTHSPTPNTPSSPRPRSRRWWWTTNGWRGYTATCRAAFAALCSRAASGDPISIHPCMAPVRSRTTIAGSSGSDRPPFEKAMPSVYSRQ